MCTAFKRIRVMLEKNHDYVECETSGESAWYVIEDQRKTSYQPVDNFNVSIEADDDENFRLVRVQGDDIDYYDDGQLYDIKRLVAKIESLIG